jgi:hypothetical protein
MIVDLKLFRIPCGPYEAFKLHFSGPLRLFEAATIVEFDKVEGRADRHFYEYLAGYVTHWHSRPETKGVYRVVLQCLRMTGARTIATRLLISGAIR